MPILEEILELNRIIEKLEKKGLPVPPDQKHKASDATKEYIEENLLVGLGEYLMANTKGLTTEFSVTIDRAADGSLHFEYFIKDKTSNK